MIFRLNKNSVEPIQLASSEASWSGSTQFYNSIEILKKKVIEEVHILAW